jgi:hypothetical protein
MQSVALRQYYERLRAAGKPGKVAVIAAMRKLLGAVWSVFSSSPTVHTCIRPPIDSRGQCGHRWGHFRVIALCSRTFSANAVELRAQDSPNDRWCPELRQRRRHVENILHPFLNYGIAGGTRHEVPISGYERNSQSSPAVSSRKSKVVTHSDFQRPRCISACLR